MQKMQTQTHVMLHASVKTHHMFLQLEEELSVVGTPSVSHSSEWVPIEAPGRRAVTLELDGDLWTILGGDPTQDVAVSFCGAADALNKNTTEFPELAAAFRRAFKMGTPLPPMEGLE